MRKSSPGPWLVVSFVGVAVVALVLGLGLFKRLDSGQKLLNDLTPAFTVDRAAGAKGGVTMVSNIVDFAQPVVDSKAKATAEVPALIGLVSKKTGLSQAEVVKALAAKAPHTTALLQAVPLSAVSSELPRLVAFLATALKTTPEKVQEALAQNFPALTQAITALPKVTAAGTRCPAPRRPASRASTGRPCASVPDVRDYFGADLVPVVTHQQENLTSLASNEGVGGLPWILLIVGVIVTFFGLFNARAAKRGELTRYAELASWGTVTLVGTAVVVLVLALNLFGRLSGATRC